MELWSLFLYLLATLAFLKFVSSLFGIGKRNINLPPGPFPFPILGNLHKLGDKPHKSLADLSKTHGPIMSLKLGQITAVVVSSSTVAREVLQKQDLAFCNRFVPDATNAHNNSKYSTVFLPVGDRWRSLRKVMNTHIFSGNRLDHHKNMRRKKVEEMISFVRSRCEQGAAVDIGCAAFTTAINLLSNTIFSVDLTDPNEGSASKDFRDLIWNIMLEAGKPNLVDYFPCLATLDPQGIRKRLGVYLGKLNDIFSKLIDERMNLRKSGGRISTATSPGNDVIDNLLNISEQNNDQLDKTQILHLCFDLFAAGSDTTSSTVEWMMTELLCNPDTLSKAKAELEEMVGRGKVIDEADIACLPYLRAIVRENWRLHPPAPFLIPRKVETDVQLCGFTVPKGAQVLVNAWAIGRDPELWVDPISFRPERFLDSDIDVCGQDFELIPFGAGRRICPGLPMAIRMVPVMVGSLINSFDWKLGDGIGPHELDMDDKFGITLQKAQPLLVVPISV